MPQLNPLSGDLSEPTSAAAPEFASIQEIQRLGGGESRASIYRALARGELLAVKRGRRTLIVVESARRRLRNLPIAKFRAPGSKA